ncbi:MAG: response regulator [Candidatus Omnitrophica bacterium]|nr:response regulator [Candidatus Omnitrophota bacterium]
MSEKKNLKEILLVDDDPDYSELTRTRLEASGYRVASASNGREALELLEHEHHPNLIIMDVEMPDKNGLTTLINIGVRQKIQEKDGKIKIPVIVATGFQSEKVREVMMAQDISGYLKKPYSSEELIQAVRDLIG